MPRSARLQTTGTGLAGRGRRAARWSAVLAGATGVTVSLSLAQGVSPAAAKGHSSVVVQEARRGPGTILVSAGGATLYRFTPDPTGTPTCTGACAVTWPPLTVPAGTKPRGGAGVRGLGAVRLAGGRLQVTYLGKPLYRYSLDSGASTAGQGVDGTWFVVRPKGAARTAASPATTTTQAPSGGGYGY